MNESGVMGEIIKEVLSGELKRKHLRAHNGADQACVLWLIPLPLARKHNPTIPAY